MNRTNCANCGAVLEYQEKNYGSVLSCPYCKTEYHIDKLGKFDEYKIEFEYMGRRVRGYVGDVKFHKVFNDVGRNLKGELVTSDYKMFLDMNIIGEFLEYEEISI